ncbi:MAG: glycosyltransferase family 2 protein [Phycisphaerae bacterium]|nr:glycosyltransferase family 2 protein [Phycisphaerae bacterium]
MAEKESNPFVSVIIPTYNRSRLLVRSVKSVLNQTYRSFELIIVDDASTDNTEKVVRSFNDERIRYVRHEKNRGEAAARNTGIKAAKYDYVAQQDSDDEWLPEKLAKQVRAFENCPPQIGVVYTGFWKEENGQRTYIPFEWVNKKDGDIHQQLLKGNFVGSPVTLVKKECFEKAGMFNEGIFHLVDWELWLRISKYYHFKCVDEPLAIAYYHSDNVSFNYRAFIEALESILEKYSDEFAGDKKLLAKHYIDIGNRLVVNKEMQYGRNYLIKAVKLCPSNVKLLLAVFSTFFGLGVYKKAVRLLWKYNEK